MRVKLTSLASALWIALAVPVAHAAIVFDVDTTEDTPDDSLGDHICADSQGKCSFRAAVMETNRIIHNLVDTDEERQFDIRLPPGDYFLTRAVMAGDPSTGSVRLGGSWNHADVTIRGWDNGAPPAAWRRPSVRGSAAFGASLFHTRLRGTTRLVDLVLRDAHSVVGGSAGAAAGCQFDALDGDHARVHLEIERTLIANNFRDGGGRALYADGCHLSVRDTIITGHDEGSTNLIGMSAWHSEPTEWVFERTSIVDNPLCSSCQPNTIVNAGVAFAQDAAQFLLTIADSTISNNSGVIGATAVAVGPDEPLRGRVVLRNVTLTDGTFMPPHANAAAQFNGIVATNVLVEVANTAMPGSVHGIYDGAVVRSLGYNLLGTLSGNSNGVLEPHATDLPTSDDPQLGSLKAIGYYAIGRLPAADGPLVDAGHPGVPDELLAERCTPRDARGVVRPVGAGCDVGAAEYFDANIFADGFEWS